MQRFFLIKYHIKLCLIKFKKKRKKTMKNREMRNKMKKSRNRSGNIKLDRMINEINHAARVFNAFLSYKPSLDFSFPPVLFHIRTFWNILYSITYF